MKITVKNLSGVRSGYPTLILAGHLKSALWDHFKVKFKLTLLGKLFQNLTTPEISTGYPLMVKCSQSKPKTLSSSIKNLTIK